MKHSHKPDVIRLVHALTFSGLLLGSFAANAATVTYNLSYSGAQYGNSATGTGFISFDDTVLPNGPINLSSVSPETLGIVDFSITIAGASAGNGTFVLADFAANPDGWIWDLTAPVDLGAELVGQAGFGDFNWCGTRPPPSCGNPDAPGGTGRYRITTAGETGDDLRLTSMAPAAVVPIPAAAWLFGSGLLGLIGIARSKKP